MRPNRRKNIRRALRHGAMMIGTDGTVLGACQTVDVSSTGAQLRLRQALELPDQFTLLLSRHGEVRRQCSVKWRSEDVIGVQFAAEKSAKP